MRRWGRWIAPEDFARVQEVARRQGVTVTALCRGAILDALDAKRDLVAALTSVDGGGAGIEGPGRCSWGCPAHRGPRPG